MDLNDLKSEWGNVGGQGKSKADLEVMTKASKPIKKIRLRLLIEGTCLLLFLVVYYDWFDGHEKSWEVNALLVIGVLFNLGNDILGYFALRMSSQTGSVKESLNTYLGRVRRLSFFSKIASAGFLISVLAFYLSVVEFTREKYPILVVLFLILFATGYFTHQFWKTRISSLQNAVNELEE
jgi:hypothetical protein